MTILRTARSDGLRLLFIGPLPDPLTGQSLACQILHSSLVTSHKVCAINLSKTGFSSRYSTTFRLYQIAKILMNVWREAPNSDAVYFTNSESMAGNLKDFFIYLSCWPVLSRMTVHLHGGVGMRVLMSDRHPIIRLLNGFFLRRVGAVVVLGDRLREIYDGVVPNERLHVIPNFAGDEFFVDEPTVVAKFLDVRPLRLLFLSNLLQGKGHKELLASILLLPDDIRRNLHIDFAGAFESKDEEVAFRRDVDRVSGMSIAVHGPVHGQLKQSLLAGAHIFCLPTYYPYEGQPISLLEAYASGCAVMTTDHGGIFDVFTPGINGVQVAQKSPQSIAQSIVWAVMHTEDLCIYGKNNLKDAKSKFRVHRHVDALTSVIISNSV